MSDETMNQLQRAIGSLEAKIDQALAGLNRIDSLDLRISALEKNHARLMGFTAALGVVWGIVQFVIPLLVSL
jgi:hypothetical protein